MQFAVPELAQMVVSYSIALGLGINQPQSGCRMALTVEPYWLALRLCWRARGGPRSRARTQNPTNGT